MPRTSKSGIVGLQVRRQADGSSRLYWIAPAAARAKGFSPKTVRVPAGFDDGETAALCARLQSEADEWLGRRDHTTSRIEVADDGTVRWIATAFEVDPDSPYQAKRTATQTFYSRHIKLLLRDIGDRKLKRVVGKDVRGWHGEWSRRHGQRTAYGCIQTLRRVVGYGISDYSDDGCIRLGLILKNLKFSPPAARTEAPTYDDVTAFRREAHKAGLPSLALAQALQFEVGLRQRDVIGETSNGTWSWGLTWDHIDTDLVLRKPTSKSNGDKVATFDLKSSPDIIAELQNVPRGIGPRPVVICEATQRPWTPSAFSRAFRRVATAAGWPPNVWNMDSRAGAVSEAFEAGAAGDDVMKMATHTKRTTTEIYNRGSIVQANRVITLRQEHRRKAEQD